MEDGRREHDGLSGSGAGSGAAMAPGEAGAEFRVQSSKWRVAEGGAARRRRAAFERFHPHPALSLGGASTRGGARGVTMGGRPRVERGGRLWMSERDVLRQRWAVYLTTINREETRREVQVRLAAGDWGGVTSEWVEEPQLKAWARELAALARGEQETCTLEVGAANRARHVVVVCRAARDPAEMLVWVEMRCGAGTLQPEPGGRQVEVELRALRTGVVPLVEDIDLLNDPGVTLFLSLLPAVRALRAERPTTPMYCRKCYYDLQNLSELRCPECGTAFDPLDIHTYLLDVPNATRRTVERVFAIVVIALIAAAVIMLHAGPLGFLGGS